MSMPRWMRKQIGMDTCTETTSTNKNGAASVQTVNEPVSIIMPTAEPQDTIVRSLAEHDAKFHPNGLKPTEHCKFREAFCDEPAEPVTSPNPWTEVDTEPMFAAKGADESEHAKPDKKSKGKKTKKH